MLRLMICFFRSNAGRAVDNSELSNGPAADGLESEPNHGVVYNQTQMRNHLRATRPLSNSSLKKTYSRPSKTEWFDEYCHCHLTGAKAASDRMVWCNGGCKQWYHDTCEQIDKEVLNSSTVETVKSNIYTTLIYCTKSIAAYL